VVRPDESGDESGRDPGDGHTSEGAS
jgi:hypothetical protein